MEDTSEGIYIENPELARKFKESLVIDLDCKKQKLDIYINKSLIPETNPDNYGSYRLFCPLGSPFLHLDYISRGCDSIRQEFDCLISKDCEFVKQEFDYSKGIKILSEISEITPTSLNSIHGEVGGIFQVSFSDPEIIIYVAGMFGGDGHSSDDDYHYCHSFFLSIQRGDGKYRLLKDESHNRLEIGFAA